MGGSEGGREGGREVAEGGRAGCGESRVVWEGGGVERWGREGEGGAREGGRGEGVIKNIVFCCLTFNYSLKLMEFTIFVNNDTYSTRCTASEAFKSHYIF